MKKFTCLFLVMIIPQLFAGPVASWKFDSSKRKLDDYASGQHKLTMVGEAAKFGKKGFNQETKYAAQFNGIEDSMVLIKGHDDFDTDSFSFLAHSKSDIKKDGKYRAVFYAREKDGFALYLSPRGCWEFWTKGGGMTWNKHKISEVVENQWEQFLISYNADSKNPQNLGQGHLQIWQNGDLKVDTYTEYKAAKSKLSIGSSTVGTANFKGLIDNVEYWNSPLMELKASSISLPAELIDQDLKIAELKLSSLNFNFDTKFEILGSAAKLCQLKNSQLVLKAGADLRDLKSLELKLKASGTKLTKDCEINFYVPVGSSTASKTKLD